MRDLLSVTSAFDRHCCKLMSYFPSLSITEKISVHGMACFCRTLFSYSHGRKNQATTIKYYFSILLGGKVRHGRKGKKRRMENIARQTCNQPKSNAIIAIAHVYNNFSQIKPLSFGFGWTWDGWR